MAQHNFKSDLTEPPMKKDIKEDDLDYVLLKHSLTSKLEDESVLENYCREEEFTAMEITLDKDSDAGEYGHDYSSATSKMLKCLH